MSKNKKNNHKLENKKKRKIVYFDIQKYASFILGFGKFSRKLSVEFVFPKMAYVFFMPLIIVFVFGTSFITEGFLVVHEIEEIANANYGELFARAVHVTNQPAVSVNAGEVKGIYLTMWTVGQKQKMEEILKLIDETDINSVVIDVKGSQGELIYEALQNVDGIIRQLREKNIYTIARVVVFQDSGYAKSNPEVALKNKSGDLWRDRRGFAWIDPAAQGSWEHIVDVAKKSIDLGFNEIQYDYIRFPTDGNLLAIVYPAWDGQKPRSEVLKEFFAYSRDNLKRYDPRVNISLDIFGYTFLRNDDLGIGQVFGDTVEYFDYISPMVYPSHYGAGNFGFENPAEHPYEVIYKTIEEGLEALGTEKANIAKMKIRPWLQVFDMGARYDSVKIRAQIKAVEDSGLNSWLMWDPKNLYGDVREAIDIGGKEGVAEIK